MCTEISTGVPITGAVLYRNIEEKWKDLEVCSKTSSFHVSSTVLTTKAQHLFSVIDTHTHTHTLEQHVRKFLKFLQNWLWVGIGQLGKYRDVFVKSTVIFIIKLNKHHTWIYFYHELMPFHCAFSCLMIRSSFLSEQKKIKHCLDQKIWLTYSDPVSLYPH